MEAVAHNPTFAKKAGVPQSVGKDFSNADKGKTFQKGGDIMATKPDPRMLAMMMAKKRAAMGAGAPPTGAPMGIAPSPPMGAPMAPGMKKGGKTKKMAKGGSVDVGNSTSMGKVRNASPSRDGVASKGKTKGKQIVMAGNKGMKKGGKVC